WGANAMNGVINIITKPASQTQGGLVEAGLGTVESSGYLRYGGRLSESITYRASTYHSDTGPFEVARGDAAYDEWRNTRLGLRLDWDLDPEESLAFDAHLFDTDQHLTYFNPFILPFADRYIDTREETTGGHLLARWRREVGDEN